ncbi:uncharacterized protein EMH_0089430 [Eimeria mitis]|uniref:Uncharacterized protein n=1 Tax=Eimeria mitis TaxID=44415 RepID=U6KJU7_9EIME|nr:uncharacterized protein EMH_0089430 [Eimeria mitis]CDJ36532.1 hypothetical protein, conserved [Eimeria mitis]
MRAQVEAALTSLEASSRGRKGTAISAARDCTALTSQPVPPPPLSLHAASSTTESKLLHQQKHLHAVGGGHRIGGVGGGDRTEAPHGGVDPTPKWLSLMRDCTRFLWSLIAAATLAAPLPDWPAPRICMGGGSVSCAEDGGDAPGDQAAASVADSCEGAVLHANCNGCPSVEQAAPSVTRGEPEETGHVEPFWPLETGPGNQHLLQAALKARRQLFKLRQGAESSSGKEETGAGAGEEGCRTQTRSSVGFGDGLRQAHAARHLLLDLLQGLQRIARAWFVFGEAAWVFEGARDGYGESIMRCTVTPPWASDLLDASIACLSCLWALAACSQSLGLVGEEEGNADTLGTFQKQQAALASACCVDILRLCAWSASLQAKTSPGRTHEEVMCTELNACEDRCLSLWEAVYVFICERGLRPLTCPERAPRHVFGDRAGRSRWVRLALLQIQRLCGTNNEHLQQLIAVAEGL